VIEFTNVTISFGGKSSSAPVTQDFTLALQRNEFTCILGPSGCGKTTLLNAIAGFQLPIKGSVSIDGIPVRDSKTRVSYVFQGHNIFPWKTVRQNILFGVASLHLSLAEKNNRVRAIADEVGLIDYLEVYPNSLSGGMQQRVGIARALIGKPDIILMDEPLASLDALTAFKTRELLKDLVHKQPTTVVFVTHNIDEALELADRVLVVSKSPMKLLIDSSAKNTTNNDSLHAKKRRIYATLESNMSE